MTERLGVSQAQVARIEQRGYDAYTLATLRRYVQAVGGGFALDIAFVARMAHVTSWRPRRRPEHAFTTKTLGADI